MRKCFVCGVEIPTYAASKTSYQKKGLCGIDCTVLACLNRIAKSAELRRNEERKFSVKVTKRKEYRKAKKEYRQNDMRIRRKAAKDACHAYVRERDKGKNCICCNKPLGEKYHAGHWLESGNNPQVRYDERNINAQRVDCNYFKGGDSGDYEKNLRAKIGDANVDELLTMKGGKMRRTAQDYSEIEKYYKQKYKDLVQLNSA